MREMIRKLKRMLVSPSFVSVWQWTAGYRIGMLGLSLAKMLGAAAGLAYTLVIKELVDAATCKSAQGMKQYAILLVVIMLVQLLLYYFPGVLEIYLRTSLTKKLQSKMVNAALQKQYSALTGTHSAELTSKILSDSRTVTNGIVDIVPDLLSLMTQFIGAFFILIGLDFTLVMMIVVTGVVGAALIGFLGNKIKKYHKVSREKEDRVLAVVQELFQNIRIIKASRIEQRMENKVHIFQNEFMEAQWKRGRFQRATNTSVNLIFLMSELYAMLWGCYGIYRGTMSYGMMAAMLSLVGQIQGPIANLAKYVSQTYGMVSSAERLDEVLSLPDEEHDMMSEDELQKYYGDLQEIRMKDVTFSYGRESILEGASLVIRPGDVIAITGHSGIGKSTLFLLLLGLYQPTSGSIHFVTKEGVYTPEQMRKLFSYVPQGNALFSGTLRDNIGMFRNHATEDEIWNAAKLACIDEFIASLEQGLDTRIREKGLGLSEGQAQRIAIARAILSDAPILLLDEATSALDDETERQVLNHIAELNHKTCLIVTHRKRALEICNGKYCIADKKIVME